MSGRAAAGDEVLMVRGTVAVPRIRDVDEAGEHLRVPGCSHEHECRDERLHEFSSRRANSAGAKIQAQRKTLRSRGRWGEPMSENHACPRRVDIVISARIERA